MPTPKLDISFQGWMTAPGQLAQPPGAMTRIENFILPAPGRAEPRKPFRVSDFDLLGAGWCVISTKQLGANILINNGGTPTSTQLQYTDLTGAPTTLATPDGGNVANVPTARMKAAISLRNHFLTSTRAPLRLQSDFSLYYAGMPRSPGMHWRQQGTAQLAATATWLAVGFAVAYRTVWVMKDADGVEIASAPSGRWVVTNTNTTSGYTGGALCPRISVAIPQQADTTGTAITTSWKVRVYRSIAANIGTTQPNDELQLCYEAAPTAGNIAAGYIQIDDVCPESALGAFLYTNTVSGGDVTTGMVRPGSTSLGLAASNDRPPLAKDVAQYADCLWYANFTTLQRYRFSILATGAGGLAVGDVLTIDGTALTATNAAVPAANQFRVETGLASTSINLRQTAMNLVAAINLYCANLTAAYIGSDASPGTIGAILLEAKKSDASIFFLSTSGVTSAFLPSMSSAESTQDTWYNGLAVSKPFQGDAVPPANYLRVGRNDAAIQRIVPLRDALYIFTDDGIYWARGSQPADFVVESFDLTFRLAAREACVAVGDAIYAWGKEGIARIENGGVTYIDLPIRNFVQTVRGLSAPTDFATNSFAVAYPTQRRVLFFYRIGVEAAYSCCRALTYNIATDGWSETQLDSDTFNGRLSGAVRWSDELLILGQYSGGAGTRIFIEDADYSPYADDCYDPDTAEKTQQAIRRTLEWAAQTPSPAMLCHWGELQVYAEPTNTADSSYSISVSVTSDHGGTEGAILSAVTDLTVGSYLVPGQQRLILGQTSGMAVRQVARLEDSGSVVRTYNGMAFIYTPMSNLLSRL